MNVLLTGGTGFLGGRLAEALTRAGCDVTLGTRSPERLPPWTGAYRVLHTAWQEPATLRAACVGVEAIVHLAGTSARHSTADPAAALAANGVGTTRLVDAACQAGVRRLLYMSTAHVYGTALCGVVDEDTCPQPRHPYATSHRAAEDVVRAAQYAGRLEGLVVRLSNSYGAPADSTADCWSLFTNDLCLQAVRSQRLVLDTNGEQRRDFVPLSEVCRALMHLLAVPARVCASEVLNVGGDAARTLREMAACIAARVDAVLGFMPAVIVGERSDGVGNALLEYRSARLHASGFVPDPLAPTAELDRLIRFCQAHSGSLP